MLPDQFKRRSLLLLQLIMITWSLQMTVILSIRMYDKTSIYDALESHGLPIGLLPKGVKDFNIKEDGFFEAHLDQVCRSKLDNQFEYKTDISGHLSYGRVGNLTGMESLELFVWVSVNGIRVDIPNSGRINFDLDRDVHKELSISLFETPADCFAVSTAKKFDRVIESRGFGQSINGRDIV